MRRQKYGWVSLNTTFQKIMKFIVFYSHWGYYPTLTLVLIGKGLLRDTPQKTPKFLQRYLMMPQVFRQRCTRDALSKRCPNDTQRHSRDVQRCLKDAQRHPQWRFKFFMKTHQVFIQKHINAQILLQTKTLLRDTQSLYNVTMYNDAQVVIQTQVKEAKRGP